jgi:GNAT superfamily N-acetyltransferase
VVRRAEPAELLAVQAVSVAAGERFRSVADRRIGERADDPPFDLDELAAAQAEGRLWVAVEDDAVVGFVVVEVIDGCAHVEEVSVHPDRQGHGHGAALLDTVASWAAAEGLAAVTLTTFADVPWNRPYYERRGYRVLAEDELTPGLRARREHEASIGLDPTLRVVMRRELPAAAG